jgi:hypothetical protein
MIIKTIYGSVVFLDNVTEIVVNNDKVIALFNNQDEYSVLYNAEDAEEALNWIIFQICAINIETTDGRQSNKLIDMLEYYEQ